MNKQDEFTQKVAWLQALAVSKAQSPAEACRLLTKSGASPCQLPTPRIPTKVPVEAKPPGKVLPFSRARAVIHSADGPFQRPKSCQLV